MAITGDLDILGYADHHQVHVIMQELHFLLQVHVRLLVIVEDMAEHLRKVDNGLLRLLRVECRQRIDIVHRVEKEMRIHLLPQVDQLRLRHGRLRLPLLRFRLRQPLCHQDRRSRPCTDTEVEEVADNEENVGIQILLRGQHLVRKSHDQPFVPYVVKPLMLRNRQQQDKESVERPELFLVSFQQHRRKHEIIEIGHNHHGQRNKIL